MDGHRHSDGLYGWSMVLDNPLLQVSPLPSRHTDMLLSQEVARRLAQAVMELQLSENRPQHQSSICSIIMMAWWSVSKLLCLAALRSINRLLSLAYEVSRWTISGL